MDRIDDMNGNIKRVEEFGDKRARQLVFALFGVALSLALGSCAQPSGPTVEQATAPTAVTLVAGDVIKLTFPGAPELTQSQKIRTDGRVNLPLIGEVAATGKTVPALQSELGQRYKSELKTSTVVVTLE